MQTRPIGNTGIQVSVVGLGAEHLDNQPQSLADEVIGAAFDRGITILDLFMPGKAVRTNIGRALKGRRQKMCIQGAIGSVDLSQQYDISRDLAVCRRYFEELLHSLETDYIDIGMLFYLDTHEAIDAMLDNGVVDYARKLKQAGTIRAIGASTHNPDTARRLVEEGLAEVLLFSINPAFDMMPDSADVLESMAAQEDFSREVSRLDTKRADLYRLCASRGVGITVMKSMAAGKLLSTDHSPFARAMTPIQCIHYALTRPAVASVLVGCKSRAEVEAATAYADADEAARDYTRAVSAFREDGKAGFRGSCVYCNHCLPCPAALNIAAVTRCLDIARLDAGRIPPETAAQYHSLEAHAGDCVRCGSCEDRCPFSVPVMDNMRAAAALFGS